jgi:hypothetical protein
MVYQQSIKTVHHDVFADAPQSFQAVPDSTADPSHSTNTVGRCATSVPPHASLTDASTPKDTHNCSSRAGHIHTHKVCSLAFSKPHCRNTWATCKLTSSLASREETIGLCLGMCECFRRIYKGPTNSGCLVSMLAFRHTHPH